MKYLFTSDWHIRSNSPVCRKDDFFEIQKRSLETLSDISIQEDAPIVIAGDIFDHARPDKSQELENLLIDVFSACKIYFISGNHDLVYHRFENLDKCSVGVLSRQPNWFLLDRFDEASLSGFSFDQQIEYKGKRILIAHTFCDKTKNPFIPSSETPSTLFEKYSEFEIIVTGDNHKSFVEKKKEKILFNPGCLTRQSVNEKYYKPQAFLFDPSNNEYEIVSLPDSDESVIDDSHLTVQKERDERLEKFIKRFQDGERIVELDFRNNILNYIKENNISKKVEEKILMAMQED